MAEGTNNNKTEHWLDRSNSHGLLLIIDTRVDQSVVYLHQIMAADNVLELDKSNVSHNISWLSPLATFLLFLSVSITMESQRPFESAEYMVWKAGRRAQSWLVTCSSSDNTLSIWAPSSRLSFKGRLLMGRKPEESNGICKEILHRNRCKESHKTKTLY